MIKHNTEDGKIPVKIQENSKPKFNFDLERMKEAMESPRIKIPASAIATDEAFEAWINNE